MPCSSVHAVALSHLSMQYYLFPQTTYQPWWICMIMFCCEVLGQEQPKGSQSCCCKSASHEAIRLLACLRVGSFLDRRLWQKAVSQLLLPFTDNQEGLTNCSQHVEMTRSETLFSYFPSSVSWNNEQCRICISNKASSKILSPSRNKPPRPSSMQQP